MGSLACESHVCSPVHCLHANLALIAHAWGRLRGARQADGGPSRDRHRHIAPSSLAAGSRPTVVRSQTDSGSEMSAKAQEMIQEATEYIKASAPCMLSDCHAMCSAAPCGTRGQSFVVVLIQKLIARHCTHVQPH